MLTPMLPQHQEGIRYSEADLVFRNDTVQILNLDFEEVWILKIISSTRVFGLG